LSLLLQSPITVESPGGNAVNLANLAGAPFTSGESATLTAGDAAVTNITNPGGANNTGLRIQSAGSAIITASGAIAVDGTASDWAILDIAQGQTAPVMSTPVTAMVTYGSPGAPGPGLSVGSLTLPGGTESGGIQADNRGNGDAIVNASGNITGVGGAGFAGFYGLLAHANDIFSTGGGPFAGDAAVFYHSGTIEVDANNPRGILVWTDGDGSSTLVTDPGTKIIVTGGGPGAYVYAGSATAANDRSVSATVASEIMTFGPASTDPGNRPWGIGAFSGEDAPIFVTYTGPGITTQGGNGIGIRALSDSGSINVDLSGPIKTNGSGAHGVFAQSGSTTTVAVGLGGPVETLTGAVGPGGDIVVTTSGAGAISTLGDGSTGIRTNSTTGTVQVTALGAISTQGAESHGIWANSTTGTVQVSATNVSTGGEFSTAINATGGGDVTVNIPSSGSIMGGWQADPASVGPTDGLPAAGVILSSTGGAATLTNDGSIGALSDRAVASSPLFPSNNTSIINNSDGTITGFAQLVGGNNSIVNDGTFNLRHFADTNGDGVRDTVRVAVADLGAGLNNTFTNNGRLALAPVTGATTLDSTGQYLPVANTSLGNTSNAMALNGGPLQGQIIGVQTFTNSGVIDLQSNPVPGD
jgi:hypothetical protein